MRSNSSMKRIFFMRLLLLCILMCYLQIHANGHAQNITLSTRNIPLEKIFKEIQRRTGCQLLFTHGVLKKTGNADIKVSNASLKDALRQCLKSTQLTYSIVEKTVVIKKKEDVKPNLFSNDDDKLLARSVSDRVVDEGVFSTKRAEVFSLIRLIT